jgi:RNA polymerase sigma-70 factor (ECF subfamily)
MASRDVDDRVERLIEANAQALLAFFMRRTAQPEDSADLLGDTLLVVWRKARSLPADDGEARMWLFGVARKVLSTQRRGQKRRDALQERLRSELSVIISRQDDDHPELSVALSRLDPLDQEIIRLVHWDGFTQAQSARLLDLEEGTVRSRHHRARQRLRSLLDGSTTPS